MSVEEIINSGLAEQYVLGVCSEEEAALINRLCKTHPELAAEIERIEKSLIQYAASKAPRLRPDLKEEVLAKVSASEVAKESRIVSLDNPQNSKLRLYQVGLAASVILFVCSVIYTYYLQQKMGELNQRISELNESKSYLVQEIKIKEASISSINQRLQVITNPGIKSVTLNGMNSLQSKYAMVYWNSQSGDVFFNAIELPDSPVNKQYQLWAIVNGKPVDAGIIDLSPGDSLFQKMKSIKGASAFAVTVEKNGGSETPSLETMCLLGNV